MTPKKHLLLFWFYVLLVTLFAMAAVTVVLRWHRIFPSHETSELYRRYENHEHIDVSFVKDFRVNDTIAVDVTLIEATDSAGWKRLKEDFDIIEAEDLPLNERENFNARYNNSISVKLASSNKNYKMPDTNICNNDVFAYEREKMRVTVFHTANSANQENAWIYLLEQMTNKNNLNIQK